MKNYSNPNVPKVPSKNLALTRYLMVLVLFVIIGLIALMTEREYLFGSKKAQQNKHLHDHHLAYHQQEEEAEEQPTTIPFKNYNLEKNRFNDENPQRIAEEHLDAEKARDCLIYGPNEHLTLVDVVDSGTPRDEPDPKEKIVDVTSEYFGKVTLFVNVASKCGFTDSGYKALVRLYELFEAQDHDSTEHRREEFHRHFRIAAIPSNDFGKQEPGSIDEIRHFAEHKYGAKFHIYQKAVVKGENAIPLFKKLVRCSSNGNMKHDQEVTWNWNFFLVDQLGRVVARFPPGTPAAKMAEVIEPMLFH